MDMSPSCAIDTNQISDLLNKVFQPQMLQVFDDSALHAGHAYSNAGHFRIEMTSRQFEGKTRLQIHRMIYKALEPFMKNGIHALSIDAKAV